MNINTILKWINKNLTKSYVVEEGSISITSTINIKYKKYNTGEMVGDLVATSNLDFASGIGNQIGANITITLPSSTGFISINNAQIYCNSSQGYWGGGVLVTGLKLQTRLYSPAVGVASTTYTIRLIGTWK